MIPLVIDSNIFFSAMYNKSGLERKILDLSMLGEIQLFAPDVFKEEIIRNFVNKIGYSEDYIRELIQKYKTIDIPQEKYRKFLDKAKELITHREDYPLIATSYFLKCPIWSGNKNHFDQLRESKDIIWFTSKDLIKYLKDKKIEL